jgi:hypothetical protein
MRMMCCVKTVIVIAALTVHLTACSGNKALELFETAKFEEMQNNREHAVQLCGQMIAGYPASERAISAKKRIDELTKQ